MIPLEVSFEVVLIQEHEATRRTCSIRIIITAVYKWIDMLRFFVPLPVVLAAKSLRARYVSAVIGYFMPLYVFPVFIR